jgi:UDP-3-O-[3-hydroxymyristoyl] N-acetylglucosamine deacetylase/3-hydroxyacyl-[acyl-carrier-protein] dehydratase
MKQMTIDKEVSYEGIGLHTGNPTKAIFRPAEEDTGICFVRTDIDGLPRIPATIDHVAGVDRGTTLASDDVKVHTVEHLLAAVYSIGIDNLIIELNANEPPCVDGSSLPILKTLNNGGLRELSANRKVLRLKKAFRCDEGNVSFLLLPHDGFRITSHIKYDHSMIGNQQITLDITPETFEEELAPARTFCFQEEIESLRESGLIKGGSLENAIVISEEGILNDELLRFEDEFVRHKVLDLIGDLSLLGVRLEAHVISSRSGHPSNINLVRKMTRDLLKREIKGQAQVLQLDINRILEILPHRYPFILVDRILEMEVGKRAVGIKNVTINEPFFIGHFPGHPIMPGVLQIEAMGQVGGLLLMNSVPDPEDKVVYFIALDGIRFRKPVRPGDQIRFELEMLKFRGRTCKMRGEAFVDGELIAEAEMMAMVMDK